MQESKRKNLILLGIFLFVIAISTIFRACSPLTPHSAVQVITLITDFFAVFYLGFLFGKGGTATT